VRADGRGSGRHVQSCAFIPITTIRYKATLITETAFPDGSVWKTRYDEKGTLIAEVDALGQKTEYLNSDDGLPHTIYRCDLQVEIPVVEWLGSDRAVPGLFGQKPLLRIR
jgi:YD repeat-containing protein